MKLQTTSTPKAYRLTLLAGLLILSLAACRPSQPLSIEAAWGRPALSGNNAAAYFIINNATPESDRLLSASSSIAEFTEVHLSLMQDGNMIMQQQDSVDIPANSQLEFKPKDLNIMFINLKNDLNIGDDYELTLHFEKAGAITITVPVKEQE